MRIENLLIEKTEKTPLINFNSSTGSLLIKGRAICEAAMIFFEPAINWLEKYQNEPSVKTTLRIELEYFNTGSSHALFSLMKILEDMIENGATVEILWCYEDDDLEEAGEDYQSLLKVPFKFVETKF